MAEVTFKQKLFIEYPVPKELSIWGGDGVLRVPREDIDVLISTSVDELASDILVPAYLDSYGMQTQMPEDCVTVTSAMLTGNYPFQGNRLVKVTYDKSKKQAFLRYFPATITYLKKLTVEGLEKLQGDRLIYAKAYMLWKMADRELAYLKPVNMNVDNGSIDLSTLSDFRDSQKKRYEDLKDYIMLYHAKN